VSSDRTGQIQVIRHLAIDQDGNAVNANKSDAQ
jgi:hypothetical protein